MELFRLRLRFISALLLAFIVTAPVRAAAGELDGLRVFGDDGTFLGAISCEGIGNAYSRFGSKYDANSIWNQYGRYGNPYSSLSAFNPYTHTPPVIVDLDGNVVAHLSLNRYLVGTVFSPIALENYLMDECDEPNGYR